jgi:hypothetical protein
MTPLLGANLGLATAQALARSTHILAANEGAWIVPVIILIIWALRAMSSVTNVAANKKQAEARKQFEDKIAADIAAGRLEKDDPPPRQVPMQFRFPQSLSQPGSGPMRAPPTASPTARSPRPPQALGPGRSPFALQVPTPSQRPPSRPPLRPNMAPKRPAPRPLARMPVKTPARAPAPVRQQPDAPVVELVAAPLPSDKGMLPASEARVAAMIAAGQVQTTASRLPSVGAESIHRWFQPRTLRSQFILTEILQPPLSLREPR